MPNFDPTLLTRLGELSVSELEAALAAIRADASVYRETVSAENVAALSDLVGYNTQIREALAERAALADAHASSFADLDAPAPSVPETPAAPAEPAQPAVEPAAQPAAEPEGGADAPADTDPADAGADAVTAAAPRRRMGGVQAPAGGGAPALPRVETFAVAATGSQSIPVGTRLNEATLAEAYSERYRSVYGRHGLVSPGRDRHYVATFQTNYPAERTLTSERHAGNSAKVDALAREVRTNAALTAAGLCAPLETLWDIPVIGDVARPVRDALMRFQADRGGIQYRPMTAGVGQTGGIGTWTVAQDEADPLVPKTCVEIECPEVVSATVEATYLCLEFANFTTRFDPEYMRSVQESQQIAHARFAENKLLAQIAGASKTLLSTQVLGAVADTLVTLDKMIAYFRSVHRLTSNVPLRLVLPQWAMNLFRADLARRMAGDGLEVFYVSDAQIEAWFTARGVNVTWHLDGLNPTDPTTPAVTVPNQIYSVVTGTATTPGTVPGFPDVISAHMWVEGTWMYLDGGTMDLGMVRDSALNGTNRFQVFSEEWNAAAFRGLESFNLLLRLQPTGASAATVSTASVTD